MKIESIDIQATIEKAQLLVHDDKQLSAATKSMFDILILIITLLANRLNLNSTNSSKPPSSDPNRIKRPREKSGKKAGGQNGHVGTTLQKVDNPDRVEEIKIDRRELPAGQYRQVGFETRQVFDIDISRSSGRRSSSGPAPSCFPFRFSFSWPTCSSVRASPKTFTR